MPCPNCPNTSTTAPCPEPTPPGGSNCCLQVRYTCGLTGGVSTWVLDATNTACVDNTLCSPFLETCTATEYSLQQQNGCEGLKRAGGTGLIKTVLGTIHLELASVDFSGTISSRVSQPSRSSRMRLP